MKSCLAVCLALCLPVAAQMTLTRQFEQAQATREAAVRQLDQQYVAKLKQLFERADTANDMEAKSKIRAELDKFAEIQGAQSAAGNPAGKISKKEELEAVLMGAEKCQWMINEGDAYAYFRFLPDGKLEIPGSLGWLKRWEVTGPNKFRIYHQDGSFWAFRYSEGSGLAKSVKERDSMPDETKTIKVIPKSEP